MLRSSPASSMQKTYDECYLICSTAVYFEKQNNEAEALKSWRAALDQIYYHNAYKIPASYRPKTETEKALQESLHDMELQCKERVDLLDALRKSRIEAVSATDSLQPPLNGSRNNSYSSVHTSNDGLHLGAGETSVPAVNYHDLVRPATQQSSSPKPISRRPVQSGSTLIQNEIERSRSAPLSQAPFPKQVDSSRNPSVSGPSLSAAPRKTSRTPSPKGKTLKTTLRGRGKDSTKTSSGKMPSTMRNRPPDAAKAATLAWAPPASYLPAQGGFNTDHANTSSQNLKPFSRKASLDESAPATDIATPHKDNLRAPSPSGLLQSRSNNNSQPQRLPSYSESRKSNSDTNLIDFSDSGLQNLSKNPARIPPAVPSRQLKKSLAQTTSSDTTLPMNSMTATPISSSTAPPTIPTIPTSVTPSLPPPSAPPAPSFPSYRREYPKPNPLNAKELALRARPPRSNNDESPIDEPGVATLGGPRKPLPPMPRKNSANRQMKDGSPSIITKADLSRSNGGTSRKSQDVSVSVDEDGPKSIDNDKETDWDRRVAHLMKHLPRGVDEAAAKAIFNEIVVKGDEVHWDDVAGLEIAKTALKEAVVYPFLRPDLFLGLREPARGMLLFGPPGTGKTMLARAVATESRSTFFAISASSLTSKYLGESEKLVRALFSLAKALAPSIIFVDEIDSLLSSRGGGAGEHEATRRIKTEFLIQWSDLAKAAAGRETSEREKAVGDATRVLVLAATNLPWAIDEAARRRFVRRQYIPLPEAEVREDQLRRLISAQKHSLGNRQINRLVQLTDGFSGSDITALAKDAAMGPLRSLGEDLLHMTPDQIRGIEFQDFEASLINIRPSVSKQGLKQYEQWAADFGERGG